MKTINKDVPASMQWNVYEDKTYRIQVIYWCGHDYGYNDHHRWNVYLYVFDEHNALFTSKEGKWSVPFHGGLTYDKIFTQEHHHAEYDWQKTYKFAKFGCDFAHYSDDDYMEHSYVDGIPSGVLQCAQDVLEFIYPEEN